jgi:hypothetical protein
MFVMVHIGYRLPCSLYRQYQTLSLECSSFDSSDVGWIPILCGRRPTFLGLVFMLTIRGRACVAILSD